MHRFRILFAIVLATVSVAVAQAQTTATLDATSGTATISTNYTTGSAGLTLNMGFFVDYLAVGGGVYTGSGAGGVVIVRYAGGPVATGGTITSGTGLAQGYTIHTFSTVGASQFVIDGALAGPTLSGVLTGTGGFTWDSAVTLTLTGSNTYAGGTVISTGAVRVGNGGGTGSLGTGDITNNAALIINRSNAYTIPGAISGTGSLTKLGAGETTLTGNNSYTGPTTIAAGRLVVNGDLTIQSGALLSFLDLNLSPQPFVEDTTIFALINYSGIWNGGLFTYNGNVLADGSQFMVGDQEWEIDYNRTSSTGLANFTGDYLTGGSFVAITAVPEPSTLVLAAFGTALAAWAARSRRKNERVHWSA